MRASNPEWHVDGEGGALRLSGTFCTPDATRILEAIRAASPGRGTVELDLGSVQQLDAGVISLLLAELSAQSVNLQVRTAERFQPLFELCTEGCAWLRKRSRPAGLVEQVGLGAFQRVADINQAVEFVGEMTVSAGRLGQRPRTGHWSEIP